MASALRKSWIKITSWEFWPMPVSHFPLRIYRLLLSFRAGSSLYYSAANPSLENAGNRGASKSSILNKIPQEYRPVMIIVPKSMEWMIALVKIRSAGIRFPFIVKPDIGAEGVGVKRIHHEEEFREYVEKSPCTVVVQELVEWTEEFDVFYVRIPGEEKGKVTSVTKKSFLSVTGDGDSTVEQLMEKDPVAMWQIDRFRKEYPHKLDIVPTAGETRILEPIGSRERGTTFLNANHLINEGLHDTFDALAKRIEGFYYGKFDVRCRTEEDVITGQQMRVLELKGAGAEPGHIYDPEGSVYSAWASMLYHEHLLYKVSVMNHRNAISYIYKEEAQRYAEESKRIKEALED